MGRILLLSPVDQRPRAELGLSLQYAGFVAPLHPSHGPITEIQDKRQWAVGRRHHSAKFFDCSGDGRGELPNCGTAIPPAAALLFGAGDGEVLRAFPSAHRVLKDVAYDQLSFLETMLMNIDSVSCIRGRRLCPMELGSSVLDIIPV